MPKGCQLRICIVRSVLIIMYLTFYLSALYKTNNYGLLLGRQAVVSPPPYF